MKCLTPELPVDKELDRTRPLSVSYGFHMDGVQALRNLTDLSYDDHRTFDIYPDPEFAKFEGGQKTHQQKNELLVIEVCGFGMLTCNSI